MTPSLGVAQVGRELGKSPAAIIRLIQSDQLPAFRIGRTYRIARLDLDAYLARARVRPTKADPASVHQEHAVAERRCARAGL
jgi:excisionase family DNA binding protein